MSTTRNALSLHSHGLARFVFLILALLVSQAATTHAAGWRNDGTGKFPNAAPPAAWSARQGVVWATTMTAWSNGTPVISGDRIFFTYEPDGLGCLAKADGKILWTKLNSRADILTPEEIAQAKTDIEKLRPLDEKGRELNKQRNDLQKALKDNPQDQDARTKLDDVNRQIGALGKEQEPLRKFSLPGTNGDNGYSSATPVTDGKMVYAIYGTGIVVGYDVDGNRKWMRYIDKPLNDNGWGFCTSPLLVDGKLLIHVNDMQALNPATGETLWTAKTPRAWGTAAITKIGEVTVAVTPGGDIVRVADGKVLATKLFVMPYGSPIVENGIVYEVDENGGTALKLPASVAADDKVQCETLWKCQPKKDRYYASPVLYDGILYVASGNGQNVLSAIDAADGKILWEQQSGLKQHIYTSFSLAGKNLYISGENDGAMLVIEPGREYKELARIPLEKTRANPVFEGSRMYIRGMNHLFCIGK